jgi:hypothetical protein
MPKNVRNYKFLDKSRLEQVLESMLSRNLLRLANEVDDLTDIVHRLVAA